MMSADLERGELLVGEVLRVGGPAGDDEELHAVHRPPRLHALAPLAPAKIAHELIK